MKAQVLLPLAALAAVVSGCAGTSMMSGTASYGDDLYYDHSKAPVKASAPLASTAPVNVPAYQRNVATYSGASDSYSSVADSRDFSDIQSYYSQSNKAAVVDTVEIPADEAEDGYWAGGFWGSSSDQSYAERMIRFHAPFIGISYYSPLYTDAVYFGRGDWNVYVTGGDAYLVPTWGNPYYNDFYFGLGFNWRRNHLRWSFGWGLGLGWGWGYAGIYDPWYDPWYCGPYYGWGSPYYGGYYHHHHHYHHGPAHAPGHGHYAFNNRGYHYGQRGVSTTVGSRSAGSVRGTTTTTGARRYSSATRQSYTRTATNQYVSTRTAGSSRTTTGAQTGTVRRSTTQGTTQRSTYMPSETRTRSSSALITMESVNTSVNSSILVPR